MSAPTLLASIQDAVRNNRATEAEETLKHFLATLFGLSIQKVEVRRDTLSLNSVNGFIHLDKPDFKCGAIKLFFKFHHEENEEGLKEYYNSQLLEENGYPVEMPVYASHEVGKQVLIYPFKNSERMADLCKKLDALPLSASEFKDVMEAQITLDEIVLQRYLATLHEAPIEKIHDEPLLQLFHHRLVDNRRQPDKLGGRYKQFYAGKVLELPENCIMQYDDLAAFHWRINGLEYRNTMAEAFVQSFKILAPLAHGAKTYPALIGHGDAHNGNVWYNSGSPPSLSLFDPAFAGPNLPALLAEIKPTFHNIFAHPLWLYDAHEADAKLNISFRVKGDYINVEHDWELSPLRKAFLEIKRDRLWKPLLKQMRAKNLLPGNWQDYMRSALFCCPTLVMNLRAHAGNASNSHTPKTSLLGFSIAMTLASEPSGGHDTVSEFFAELE